MHMWFFIQHEKEIHWQNSSTEMSSVN